MKYDTPKNHRCVDIILVDFDEPSITPNRTPCNQEERTHLTQAKTF